MTSISCDVIEFGLENSFRILFGRPDQKNGRFLKVDFEPFEAIMIAKLRLNYFSTFAYSQRTTNFDLLAQRRYMNVTSLL